jgi:hypothetical protein
VALWLFDFSRFNWFLKKECKVVVEEIYSGGVEKDILNAVYSFMI